MNVNINTTQFITHNVSWLDTKTNIIMEGNFTKIMLYYSRSYHEWIIY